MAIDALLPDFAPPPLADPVFMAIFQNAAVSGLAMRSLINACLAHSGDNLVGEVVTVTPQRVHIGSGGRGYRLDVEATTDNGEIVLCEVQLASFKRMNERVFLYSQQLFSAEVKRGDKLAEAVANLPRVVSINILDFTLRPDGKNFHQILELVYREKPWKRGVDNFEIHHLQLPKFDEVEFDSRIPLHCWLKAILLAQKLNKPLTVIPAVVVTTEFFFKI
jgi:predicted transposase/invertase (TIGR01784 family)